MATDPHQRLTIPEYLAFERQSETRDGGEAWHQRELTSLEETLELRSIDCRLLLGDVYERVFG